ncbi:MAG: hypothetical protein QM784_20785 [Polyangiaceae bacterium]
MTTGAIGSNVGRRTHSSVEEKMEVERRTLEAELSASIDSHVLVDVPSSPKAWSLVTTGLSQVGQSEVVFTVVHTDEDRDFPEGVFNYIRALKHFAAQGKLVRDGDVSGYRAPGPFQFGEFVGVAFFDAPPIAGLSLSDDVLAGVFLREGELAMAMHCSVRRVLHRLGQAARYFPTPYWSDPSRATVYSPRDAEQSILRKFARASVSEATATLRQETMTLCVPRTIAATLAASLAAGNACAILPRRRADVRAALVWSPGQQEPEAIFAAGTPPDDFAATFVGFVPNGAPNDDIRFMEDGYAVVLCESSTHRLVRSLGAGVPLELGSSQGPRLYVAIA